MTQPPAPLFPLRRLGRSEVLVSALGLGCWQFSRGHGLSGGYWAVLSEDEIRAIVGRSLSGGIQWFDTAESYGGGESERMLAAALRGLGVKPGDVVIASKWRPFGRTSHSIVGTIDERLKNLAPFPIDLYQVHQPYSFSPVPSQMKEMAKLVAAGKVRTVGVSNFNRKRMITAQRTLASLGVQLVSNQMPYSLLDRRIETAGVMDTAKELGVMIIAYSPLAQGLLSGKYHDDPERIKAAGGYRRYLGKFKRRGLEKSRPVVEAVREVAARHSATPSQVALNWLISFHGESVVAIPGATRAAQAEENAGALRFRLTPDELDHLDRASSRGRD
jgi:aryl-alcohol dehydrogenase-like predicted oxidoreductase